MVAIVADIEMSFSPEELTKIKRLADKQGKPVGACVRDLINFYVDKELTIGTIEENRDQFDCIT